MSSYDPLIQEGRTEGKIEVALNAYSNGLSNQLIANITGMEEAEVFRILKEHGMIS